MHLQAKFDLVSAIFLTSQVLRNFVKNVNPLEFTNLRLSLDEISRDPFSTLVPPLTRWLRRVAHKIDTALNPITT